MGALLPLVLLRVLSGLRGLLEGGLRLRALRGGDIGGGLLLLSLSRGGGG